MSNSTVSRGQVSAAMAEAIIKLSESTKVIAMLQTCALAILIWDWSITLGIEIKYVWPSKWNLGKILFFLTRYLPFIDALACLSRSRVVYGNSAVYCPTQFHAETWIVTIGTHIAELILVLRTWAICGRKRWILIGFLAFQTAILIYNGVALEIFVRSIVWAGPEFAGIPGCLMKSAPGKTLFSVTYINIAVFETCIFVATMIACLQKDGGRSQLARIIWRDGLIFYVLIVLVSIINVIIMFTVPKGYWVVLTLKVLFQRVMHSVATGRILLHMREEAGKGSYVLHSENGSPVKTDDLAISSENPGAIQFGERDVDELATWIGGQEKEDMRHMALSNVPPSEK